MISSPRKFLLTPTIFLVSILLSGWCSLADEVVIERNATKPVGDFDCSNCSNQTFSKLEVINGEMTAGDLWREFNRQGVSSVERLTFYVALEQIEDSEGFGLQTLEFKIDDLTASLEGNSLFIPGYGSDALNPTAKLELTLPYDFMEKYSADSKEPIMFTSANGDPAASPKVAIEFESGIKKSHIALAGFAAFWIFVFILFNRLTKPAATKSDNVGIPTPPNRRALSA